MKIDTSLIMTLGKSERTLKEPRKNPEKPPCPINALEPLTIYQRYQTAIKLSEKGQSDIIKACAGTVTNYRDLFLQACKVISLITSNAVFYKQIESNVGVNHDQSRIKAQGREGTP